MRAIEFKSKIRENKILIHRKIQPEFNAKIYRKMTKSQFLKGYADSDSIYDL